MIESNLLILLRHFPTQDEIDNRVSADVDSPAILESSKSEVLFLGNQLKLFISRYQIGNIYCSDSKQAIQTAELFSNQLGLPIIKTRLLRNIYRPKWEGLTYSEIKNEYNDELEIWSNKPGEITFINGESLMDVRKRVIQFNLKFKDPKIVITHTSTFHSFLLENFCLDSNYAWDFKPEMYCLTVLYSGTLWALNTRDMSHITLSYK